MNEHKDKDQMIRAWLAKDEGKTAFVFGALACVSLYFEEYALAAAFFYVMPMQLLTAMLFTDYEEEYLNLGREIDGFWGKLFARASRRPAKKQDKDDSK